MDHPKKNANHHNVSLNDTSAQTRRAVLKKMVLGSGIAVGAAALPSKWTKPIVDRVVIPAHAQTSPGGEFYDNHSNKIKGRVGILNGSFFLINARVSGNFVNLRFQGGATKGKHRLGFRPAAPSTTGTTSTTSTTTTSTTPPPPGPDSGNRWTARINIADLRKKGKRAKTSPSGPTMLELTAAGCDPGRDLGLAYVDDITDLQLDLRIDGNPFSLGRVPRESGLPGLDRCDVV